jgi:hypothetical protein
MASQAELTASVGSQTYQGTSRCHRPLDHPLAVPAPGGGLREVAAELAAQGYTTPLDKPNSASAMQSMLD